MKGRSTAEKNEARRSWFDMHIHILPGVDDGPADIQESVQMLSEMASQGMLGLCATPHFSLNAPLSREYLINAYQRLSSLINRDFPQMRLYLGEELYYSPGIVDALKRKEALTLNESRYALVEFHPSEAFETVYDGLQHFVRNGYIPILAHVERLDCLWKRQGRMDALKKLCIPFQMNTSSIARGMNPSVRYCRRLIADGYIDLLGSDAHGTDRRPPDYEEGAIWIEKHFGRECLNRLAVENPMTVLRDELLRF